MRHRAGPRAVLVAVALLIAGLLWPPQVPALAAPPSAIVGLHASGNQILNTSGQPVRLRGVNRTSGEYACIQGWGIFEGAIDNTAIQAMLAWKINAVRIPLNEDCWLDVNTSGINRAYVGASYRNAVIDYVTRLTNAGIIVILDLHWAAPGTQRATGQTPMPDRDHSPAFWSSVASTFKDNTAVIFDLFNEPYPDNNTDSTAAWQCLRDGTTSAGSCPGVGYTAAGMQELLNAVRATGATNMVLVAGVGYTGLLTRWLEYRPTDPLTPQNIAASTHIYPPGSWCVTVTCWNQQLGPVAAQYPLIAGEIGQTGCAHDRLDTVIDWLESKLQHYLVWAWWTEPCSGSPSYGLITSYTTGAPTPGYGQGYKDRLATLVGSPGPGPGPGPGPSFTTAATANPASIAPGGTVTISANVTSTTAITAVVDVEVHDAADNKIHQWYDENVTFAAGQTRTFPVTWTSPASAPAGTYRVQVGIFSLGWSSQYVYSSSAATITVTAAPPPAVTCTPRPPVHTATRALGVGRLEVTVTARSSPTGATNSLDQLTLGTPRNGLVTLNGATLSPGGTISLGGATSTTFIVSRQTPGQPITVPFTIHDRCGAWPTFVGGGPTSF